MSKKDFIALADAIRNQGFTHVQLSVLADFCKSQNTRFNEALWMGYINGTNGPNGGKVK